MLFPEVVRGQLMNRLFVQWPRRYNYASLVLAVIGALGFWCVSIGAGDARLLTVEEQQVIICGDNAQNPGRCNTEAAGTGCNKTNGGPCNNENSYCLGVQQQGLICLHVNEYAKPPRCLPADPSLGLQCDEDPNNLGACYYYYDCYCDYSIISGWSCVKPNPIYVSNVGKCSNSSSGGG
jgi:hypothetical protein